MPQHLVFEKCDWSTKRIGDATLLESVSDENLSTDFSAFKPENYLYFGKRPGLKKNFDFDQVWNVKKKPSVEETHRHFSETSFRLCRGWDPRQIFRLCRGWNHRQIFRLCREDLIRVVEDLDGTVESTDTIVKLKTKIENSSTFESDPDFVKTLIKNCIDERVSRNERDLEKQKIELAKLQLAKLEKEVELQTAKNKALSLNPAAKVEEKQFETLNKETATHIGIREAEDWFRPIDLAKECDIYISSKNGSCKEIPITYGYTQDPFKNRSQNFKPKIKENYPQYLERENKNCFICGDSSHYAKDCEERFKPKESHIHNRINVNTLKVESEKQNSDEFVNLQYVNIFVENQPVTTLNDSGCQIPVLNSSLIRVQTPSEEIIT
ncbi:hypothetical protein TNCV_1455161 [Trichonephila clavipes]|nr:hypothetical protein TNCV_1455161 [Trichonephila clavipes]